MAHGLEAAYLIAGTDRPKVDRAVERLRARFAPEAVELHAAGELAGEDAVASCNALGLFGGGGRLIVVEGVEAWKARRREGGRRLPARAGARDDARARRRRARQGRAAREGVSAAKGELLLWDVPKRALQQLDRASSSASTARAPSPRPAARCSSSSARRCTTSPPRSTSSRPGRPASASAPPTSSAWSRPAPRRRNFALTDAFGARDLVARAPRLGGACSSAAATRARGRSRASPRSSPATSRGCAAAQALEARGVASKDAAARAQAASLLRRRSSTSRRATTPPRSSTRRPSRLAELDHALKGGSHLAPELELERTLIEITAPPAARPGGGANPRAGRTRHGSPSARALRTAVRCDAPELALS